MAAADGACIAACWCASVDGWGCSGGRCCQCGGAVGSPSLLVQLSAAATAAAFPAMAAAAAAAAASVAPGSGCCFVGDWLTRCQPNRPGGSGCCGAGGGGSRYAARCTFWPHSGNDPGCCCGSGAGPAAGGCWPHVGACSPGCCGWPHAAGCRGAAAGGAPRAAASGDTVGGAGGTTTGSSGGWGSMMATSAGSRAAAAPLGAGPLAPRRGVAAALASGGATGRTTTLLSRRLSTAPSSVLPRCISSSGSVAGLPNRRPAQPCGRRLTDSLWPPPAPAEATAPPPPLLAPLLLVRPSCADAYLLVGLLDIGCGWREEAGELPPVATVCLGGVGPPSDPAPQSGERGANWVAAGWRPGEPAAAGREERSMRVLCWTTRAILHPHALLAGQLLSSRGAAHLPSRPAAGSKSSAAPQPSMEAQQ